MHGKSYCVTFCLKSNSYVCRFCIKWRVRKWMRIKIVAKKCTKAAQIVGKVIKWCFCNIHAAMKKFWIFYFDCWNRGQRGNVKFNVSLDVNSEMNTNREIQNDLHFVSLLLELIVANPPLFDRKNKHFDDDKFKFQIWNEICTMCYKKGKVTICKSSFELIFSN